MSVENALLLSRLNPRRYVLEIISAIVAFLASALIIAFVFPKLATILERSGISVNEQYLPLGVGSLKLFLWAFLYFVAVHLIKLSVRFVHFIKIRLDGSYTFNLASWPGDWRYHGDIKINTNPLGMVVTASNSGCLLKRHLWKDFEARFEVKFCQKALGIVFRAADLENYFMLQIQKPDETAKDFKIVPHIRYLGNWEVFNCSPFSIGGYNIANHYFRVMLRVQGDTAHLYLEDHLVYEWLLPPYVEVNLKQRGEDSGQNGERKKRSGVSEIPFRYEYGMVGFRNFSDEMAIVQGLKIESL